MNLQINCTDNGILVYPLHVHTDPEIMYYISGTGYMRTSQGLFPFSPGTIILIPPGTEHGSASDSGFKNISVAGSFDRAKNFKSVTVLADNAEKDGFTLADLIYRNRYADNEYLTSLCRAYILFIMQGLNVEDNIGAAVNSIISSATDSFFDADFNMSELLRKSGYAEDYIRAQFKRITGKTPGAFLTNIRINHAEFLIDIYLNSLSLEQIAEQCGYTDYVYFSKKFKSVTGMSPTEYKNMVQSAKKYGKPLGLPQCGSGN